MPPVTLTSKTGSEFVAPNEEAAEYWKSKGMKLAPKDKQTDDGDGLDKLDKAALEAEAAKADPPVDLPEAKNNGDRVAAIRAARSGQEA